MQQPSVGRIVHYVSYGTPGGEYTSQCRAAIVTAVEPGNSAARDPERVALCVMNPTGLFLNEHVRQSEDSKVGGTWHWPERV
jgi:hypothetical protein